MTEAQIQLYPRLRSVPVFDELDELTRAVAAADGDIRGVRECTGLQEIEDCLRDADLVPLGAVRVGRNGAGGVVVYFGERDGQMPSQPPARG